MSNDTKNDFAYDGFGDIIHPYGRMSLSDEAQKKNVLNALKKSHDFSESSTAGTQGHTYNLDSPDDIGSDFQALPSDHTKAAFSIANDNHGKPATEADIQRKLKELGSPEYDSDNDIEFGG